MEDTLLRLSPISRPSLVMQVSQGEVVVSGGEGVDEMLRYYVTEHGCVPAFLAEVTLSLFRETLR